MVNKCKCMHLVSLLRKQGVTWTDIANIVNEETDNALSSSAYRMAFYEWEKTNNNNESKDDIDGQLTWWDEPTSEGNTLVLSDNLSIPIEEARTFVTPHGEPDEFHEQILQLQIQKMQAADYRTEVNRMYRRMAREESIKEIAREAAQTIAKSKPFLPASCKLHDDEHGDKAAILCLSDWHYGSVQDSYYNKYDPDICRQRLNKLVNEVLYRLDTNYFECVDSLYIVNLGDLVNGLIHAQIRINNRIDVITQIMEVSELLCEVIEKLAGAYHIHYVSTMDNHSRVMPDKKDSMDLESLCRITDWYVKERCKELDVVFEENIYADDIATFEILGHNVAAAHGDKDKPSNIIKNLTVHTRKPYDLMLSAHRHHFSADEENDCMLICNGSLMGTDDYAQSLRLNSRSSQTLIICTLDNAADTIYKINLN